MQLRQNQKSGRGKRQIMPFFIPMEGCKNACVYCDQQAISGASQSPEAEEIAGALSCLGPGIFEVAFYGGSFTALPLSRQAYYLQAVAPFLASGKVAEIRISTRPDCISREGLAFLKQQGVSRIELGVQSFDDGVLAASGRLYTGDEAAAACRLVKEAGLALGIQLMTGLPGDSPSLALASAFRALSLQPQLARLYPTLVLPHTPLAVRWQQGRYVPQTLEEAVPLARDIYACFKHQGIPLVRMGLNPSAQLEAAVLAGPYHAAFGHLVRCSLKRAELTAFFAAHPGDYQELLVHPKEKPLYTGDKGVNRAWLKEKWGIETIGERAALAAGEFACRNAAGAWLHSREEDFLPQYVKGLEKALSLGVFQVEHF